MGLGAVGVKYPSLLSARKTMLAAYCRMDSLLAMRSVARPFVANSLSNLKKTPWG